MSDFIFYISTAVAFVFVIEGLFYFLFPEAMKNLIQTVLQLPANQLRIAGLVSISIGFILTWLIQLLVS